MPKWIQKARDLFIGIGAVALLVFAFWNGPELWDWFIVSLAVLVGIWELVARATTGKTLSQHFWAYSQQHQKGKWWYLALLATSWFGLLVHLGWR